ncbi:MAG: hypothetical protein LBV41_13460 [Cytophagaceae bacterium]|nr:hypothetical protein [Cytophagaceae bacterium]
MQIEALATICIPLILTDGKLYSQVALHLKLRCWKMAGVVFLSATFTKCPDNMPLYAVKTCMRKTGNDQRRTCRSYFEERRCFAGGAFRKFGSRANDTPWVLFVGNT